MLQNRELLLLLALASGQAIHGQSAGVLTGSALDAQTGNAIRRVTVAVEGQNKSVETDLDGRFQFELPAGKYKLRFTSEKYNETTLDDVEVVAGQTVDASTVLASRSAVTTVDVVEKVGAIAASAEAALAERKLAAVVSDAITSDDIRKSTASDAAGALQKVTGVSIVDNGYVYVRGLGERYSATMLNNAILPTTEPEKRVVPLDLFPASLIENIKILKTYTPDLPGEFSGGLVQMQTIEFPTQKVFRVSANYGFNSVTTFDRFSSYPGGGRDFFGFDDGTRSLPSSFPSARLFPGNFTDAQFAEIGRSLPVNWEPVRRDSMRPAMSYSMAGGNTFGRVGIVGALTFSNKPQFLGEQQRYYTVSNRRPVLFTNYSQFDANTEGIKLGAVLNAALRVNGSNKLVLRNTLTRDTDKEARTFLGYNGGLDSTIENTRLRWVERGLLSTSLEGEHAAARLRNSLFKWQMTYSSSTRDEPDLREIIRGQLADGRFTFAALPQSGTRFYSELADRIYEPMGEWSLPFYRGKVSGLFKTGFRASFRDRDFNARRFRYVPVRPQTLNFSLPSNQLFAAGNIRSDGFVLREFTRGTDTYTAGMDIYAGFAMVDLAIGAKWRFVGGARIEDADIKVVTIDPLVPGQRPVTANLNNRDTLPGFNLIYQVTNRQNLRFGFGRTVSRPDFRELSPFEFTNVLGGFSTTGNPNLKRAKIDNYDFRWEWFPSGDQVVAASYFFKDFTDPIEVSIQPTSDLRQTFINAEGARNQGIEIEFRRNLRFLSPKLAQFVVQTNFTFVDSDVRIGARDEARLLTSSSRPLVGQSRFVYNVIAEWIKPSLHSSARFYLNSVSRRITDVGTLGLPDIYQERNTFLDVVYQYDVLENGKLTLRFTGENLTNNHYQWTQGGLPQRNFRMGRTFSAGTSFSLF